jgi:hypothetical protein
MKFKKFSFNCNVVLDSMHMICIGIGKFILKEIYKKNSPIFIKFEIREKIFNVFKKIKIPSSYNKVINGIKNQKALQTLIIYFYYYKIFKIHEKSFFFVQKISKILRILYSEFINDDKILKLKENINILIIKFQLTFTVNKMNKNIHNLNHLTLDLINFGPHQNNNMFHFESFNHLINLLVHTNNFYEKKLLQVFSLTYDFDNDDIKLFI